MSAANKPPSEFQEELDRLQALVAKLESVEDERQEAEEALRESEERFRQMAASIHEVFWLVSLDKRQVFYISPAYETVWGRSCASLYGNPRSWGDAIHPDDRASVITALSRAGPSGNPQHYRIIKPDGEIRWIESLAYPVTNDAGEVYRIAGISEDITDRKQAEKQAARFSRVLENSLNEIYIFDADTLRFVEVNRGARENLGYSLEELHSLTPLDLKPEFTPETFTELLGPLRARVEERIQFTTIHRRKDGTQYPIEVHLQLVDDGAPVFIAIILDITKRKRVEEALRRSEERLDLAVRGTSDGLWDAELDTGKEYWSPRYKELLGYRDDELEATFDQFIAILHPDDKAGVMEAIRLHLEENQPYDREFRMQTKCGEYRWFQSRGEALRDKNGKPYRMAGSIRDITDRKQAAQVLQESEARLAEAQRIAHFGHWAWDIRTNELAWSDEIYRIFGLELREFGATYEAFLSSVHPDDRQTVKDAIENALNGDQPYSIEHRIVRPDGTERVVHERAEITRDQAGQPLRMLGTVQDITERKHVEEELRLKQFAIDHNSNPIYWVRADGRIAYVNHAACRSLGYSREELLSMSVPDFDPDFQRETWPAQWENLREASPTTFESRHRTKQGRVFPVEISTNFLAYEGQEYLWGYVRDITRRRQAERAIRDKERQLDNLLSNIDAIILEGDPYDIYYVGGQVERILGYPREAWFADPDGPFGFWSKHLHPDDGGTIKICRKAIARGEDHSFEYRMLAKNGDTIWFYDRVTVETENGKPVKARSVMIDISERKRAEHAKEELSTQLRHAQRMEAVGQLAGGVAHDFNNLLTVIFGNVEMMLGELEPGSGENRRLLEQVLLSAERGAELVDQLLAFGRRRPVRSTVFDLKELMERMDELMRRLLRKDIHLRLHLPEEQALIKADPAQIEQVIMNLVLNARDALPSFGEIVLSCEHLVLGADTPLPRPVEPGARFVVMTVNDTGTGMDADTLDRIFEPFFTTKAVGEGTGLGLATVYGIVTDCDAQITVESALGRGSIFRIYFPAAEPPAKDR